MYSGGEDCKARIWDLKDSASQAPRCYNAGNPITSVSLHPNQVELFIGDQNGIIHRWDLKTDNTDQIVSSPNFSLSMCISCLFNRFQNKMP